jgi:hypothetical protein
LRACTGLEDVRGGRAAGKLALEKLVGRVGKRVVRLGNDAGEMDDAVEFAVVGRGFTEQRFDLRASAGAGLDDQIAARLQLLGQLIGKLRRKAILDRRTGSSYAASIVACRLASASLAGRWPSSR